MEFGVSLDLKSKIITAFVVLLFAGLLIYNCFSIDFDVADRTQKTTFVIMLVLYISILAFCFLYRVLKYVITNGKVIIKRPLGDVSVEVSDIKEVLLPTAESMKWTLRTFGNGGVFGYFGKFRNSAYGNMTWYATRTSNYLLIITKDDRKILLTPDNTDMIIEIRKRID